MTETRQMQQHKHIYIPEGITFGHKVVVIPSVSNAFTHSGDMEERLHRTYKWINRGDPLGHYRIAVDRIDIPVLRFFAGTKPHSAAIPSPVSGLLIHHIYDFGSDITAVLLPDDEPAAEDGQYMFRSMCHLCIDQQKYFLKPSRYWSLNAYSKQRFQEIIETQLSRSCQYVDAMPRYEDYFDEARTRHPNLRPYLRHLIRGKG